MLLINKLIAIALFALIAVILVFGAWLIADLQEKIANRRRERKRNNKHRKEQRDDT